jgi:FlaA1/EpsC-like NDP-sugar epimerase
LVLVTSAGGSIGSELCRQILAVNPAKLLLIEQSEFALYATHHRDGRQQVSGRNGPTGPGGQPHLY